MPTDQRHWYMEWVVNVWLTDPAICLLKDSTRGIWFDALCCMFLQDRCGQLVGVIADLARLCRTTPNAMRAAVDDLQARGAADVHERDGIVTLTNRRMRREWIARKSARVRKQRSRGKNVTGDVTGDVTPMSHPSTKSHSHSKSKKKEETGLPPVPLSLQTPAFESAWEDWLTHRREKRNKLTPLAAKGQLAECEQWGVDRAVKAIRLSIRKGWTGLFEDKDSRNGKPASNRNRGQFEENLRL